VVEFNFDYLDSTGLVYNYTFFIFGTLLYEVEVKIYLFEETFLILSDF